MRRWLMPAVRVAMWSGPRNISTAMMRAWENRGDAAVWDEPLYAYYLKVTGLNHPGAEEVIRAGETDWRKVVADILGPVPDGKPIFFQKHMTHHLLPEIDRGWLKQMANCFLIRNPREVIASYAKAREDVAIEDVGVIQQAEIFDYVEKISGSTPTVVEAHDVLNHPENILGRLCKAVGVAFTPRMLSWPPGPRSSDGVWAKHWYASVHTSRGFQPRVSGDVRLSPEHEAIADTCLPHYQRLYDLRLRA